MALVRRRRIADALEAAARQGVAVLIAPAGYGKTAALDEAFRSIGVRLDVSGGAGIESLARAIIEAAAPDAGSALAQRLRREASDGREEELANWVARRLRGFDYPFVIDDFQRVNHDPSTRSFLVRLIEATAPAVRWVIASREPPDIPTGSWIAKGWMGLEMTAGELAFTVDETAELAAELGLRIAAADIAAITAHTDGWPIYLGLILSAWRHTPALPPVTLRTQPSLYGFIQSQLWDPSSLDQRRLLTAAAFVGTIRPEVFEHAGHHDAAHRLETLARTMPLLTRSPDRTYRLHDIFRDFIRAHEPAAGADIVAGLIAAYEDRGMIPDAIDLAIEGKAHVLLVRLLERWGAMLIDEGQRSIVSRAIDVLRPPFGQAAPTIALPAPVVAAVRAYLRAITDGRPDVADGELRALDLTQLAPPLATAIALRRAILAANAGKTDVAIADLAPYLDDADVLTRATALSLTAAWRAMSQQTAEAQHLLTRVTPIIGLVGVRSRAAIELNVGVTLLYLGDPAAAEQHALLAVQFAQADENDALLRRAYSTLLSVSARLYNDITIEAEYSDRWLEVARRSGKGEDVALPLVTAIGMAAERGHYDRYRSLYGEFQRLHVAVNPRYAVQLLWARALVDVGTHKARDGALLLAKVLSTLEDPIAADYVRALCGLMWAIADSPQDADGYLRQRPLFAAQNTYDAQYVLFAASYRALAQWSLNRNALAKAGLPAIPNGTPERNVLVLNAIRTICHAPSATMTETKLRQFLEPLLAHDLAGHANFLRAAFKPANDLKLTKMELTVLRALKNGGTSQEIAEVIGKSPRTVNFHIESAIQKIGCSGRQQAVLYAIDAGWI